jgi:hypothetical protein
MYGNEMYGNTGEPDHAVQRPFTTSSSPDNAAEQTRVGAIMAQLCPGFRLTDALATNSKYELPADKVSLEQISRSSSPCSGSRDDMQLGSVENDSRRCLSPHLQCSRLTLQDLGASALSIADVFLNNCSFAQASALTF